MRPLLFALLVLLITATSSLPPRPVEAEPALEAVPLPAVSRTDGRFGVVEAFEAGDLARAAGARWERLNFFWNALEPESGSWAWDKYYITDSTVDNEVKAGMSLVGLLGNPPRWATRNGSVPRNLELPPDHPDNVWARYVSTVVRRYAGKINYWAIWNEPDIDPGQPGSTWAGSTREYYQLLKTAYLAARAANPSAKIVFAGTTYWADAQHGRKLFLERVLEEAQLDPTAPAHRYYFDVVALHIYSSVWQMHSVPLAYREALARFGLDQPLWIDETNVVPWDDPVAPQPRGGYRATLDEQASFVLQGFALALAAGVERIAVYKMRDSFIHNGEAYGLVRNNLTPRPAYVAYQVAATYLADAGPGLYQRVDGVDYVSFRQGRRWITVFWNATASPLNARLRAAGARARLVSRFGQETPLQVPLVAGDNFYTFPLPPATANVADMDPGTFIIGGEPFILVEEEVGQPVAFSPDQVFYPITGHFISFAFLEFFRQRGGLEVLGYPRTEEIVEGGRTVQYFQRARLEFYPDLSDTPYRVQLGLLNQELLRGQPAFPPADPALVAALAPSPAEQPGITVELLAGTPLTSNIAPDLLFFPQTGHSVRGAFGRYFTSRGGVEVFGYPLSEEMDDQMGGGVQHFQRLRLEYHPEGGFSLGLVGDEYLQQRSP